MKLARNTAVLSWLLIFFLASSGVNLISHTCHTCGCEDFHLFVKPYCCGNEKCHENKEENCDEHCQDSHEQKQCCTYTFQLIKIKSQFTSVDRIVAAPDYSPIPAIDFFEASSEEIVSKVPENQFESPPLIFQSGKQFVIFSSALRIHPLT
ncbi:MAG: hypothetical protein V2A54_09730 [Bacteroidota bacterium]